MNGGVSQLVRRPSLTSRLLRQVTLPLVLTWALGAAIALAVADDFTRQALDRALLDAAYGVASRVRQQGSELDLGLTSDELDILLFDQTETQFYAVWRADGSLLAGDETLLPAPPGTAGSAHRFSTLPHWGRSLRAVTLRHAEDGAFSVVVAQTTDSRTALLRRLLAYSIAPQLVLLALLAWWLRRVIRRDVRPLTALQQALDGRDANDLAPIPQGLTGGAKSSDVERLGMAINALLERVGDGVRAQREFAGNVAHELRTPLAGIRALAEYGLAQTSPQAQREQLQAIVDSQGRASHLVDQLLALALADESRSSLRLEAVALDSLVRDMVLRFMLQADQRGVDLGASGLDQAVSVQAHGALVEGILGNLIDNALRHGAGVAGRSGVVTVELVTAGAAVILAVTDNGPGVSATERERLLQRWTQGAPGVGAGAGAGLGLAIVTRYAELMHARFELVDGPLGVGLCARVLFAQPVLA